jgi:hypothetical protein
MAWVPAVPALRQAGPGYLLTLISHRGLPVFLSQGFVPLEGFTWHGYPQCLLYIKQVPGTFSR